MDFVMAIGLLPIQAQGVNVDSGFYAACAGLQAQSQALEVVAHNLANLNTAGFHGEPGDIPGGAGGVAPGASECPQSGDK
jgi:hypothetical protein